MRSVIKDYTKFVAETYVLPETDPTVDITQLDPALAAEIAALHEEVSDLSEEVEEDDESQEGNEAIFAPPEVSPIEIAEDESRAIIAAAYEKAEKIMEDAALQAEAELEMLKSMANEEGYSAGYARGMVDAVAQAKEERDTLSAEMQDEVKRFIESTSESREQMIMNTQEELADLAIAVAEKVVRISLKTSHEVIVRMIQNATDKLKRREWVHIYISGCDSKGMAQISPMLSSSLGSISDHIKIIPMQDDELGTCIIETPEEIIDASLTTQVANIRDIISEHKNIDEIHNF
ncbi:MAG: FliH/SctL family protein [Eubacteriales bacterium]